MRCFLIASLLALADMATAQLPFCGTRTSDQQHMLDAVQFQAGRGRKDQGTVYIPLKVHSVTNDGSTSHYSAWALFESLCTLNADFLPSGIQFFLEEDIHYIANTSWNHHPEYEKGEEMMLQNNVPGMVNCYIVSDPAGNCGYFTYAGDAVALNKSCLGVRSHTWAHELGHFFSLPHTFYGWEGVDYSNGKKTSEYQSRVSTQIENKERILCRHQADRFCDTYPDYISNRWTCSPDGFSQIIMRDLHDSTFRADGSLFMSYSGDLCMNRFSADQMDAMHQSIEGPRFDLQRPDILPRSLGADSLNLIYPGEGQTVGGKKLQLTWEKVAGASYYVLQISRTNNFSVVIKNHLLRTNAALIDSLTPGKDYWWRVRAYNEFVFCGIESSVGTFTTESLPVSVWDQGEPHRTLIISPNPVVSGSYVQVMTADRQYGNGPAELHDLQGNVFAKLNPIWQGEICYLQIPPEAKGMFILRLITSSGPSQTKLIINNNQ